MLGIDKKKWTYELDLRTHIHEDTELNVYDHNLFFLTDFDSILVFQ